MKARLVVNILILLKSLIFFKKMKECIQNIFSSYVNTKLYIFLASVQKQRLHVF